MISLDPHVLVDVLIDQGVSEEAILGHLYDLMPADSTYQLDLFHTEETDDTLPNLYRPE